MFRTNVWWWENVDLSWDFGWTQIQSRRATNSSFSNSYSLRSNWYLSSIESTFVDRNDHRSKQPSIELTCIPPSLTLQKKTSGMKANANSGTIPWKICWGRWQKEQESSLTWQIIHWERQQSLFSLQKTLRHAKLRLSQGTKATRAFKATASDRRSTSLSKCQQLSPPSSTEKKVHQFLVKSQDFKVPHPQFLHTIPQSIKDHRWADTMKTFSRQMA